jgi:imidazoleglycerol-phosphate dehydratase/histidinol-phosphatase
MKKVLFIDRDGTLILEPPDEQIDSLEKLVFYPGAITWLGRIARELDYELVMVSNQDGLGTASFPTAAFWPAHNLMMKTLEGEDIHFAAVHIDPSLPHENKPTRKPGIAMLTQYLDGSYDIATSFVIGDRLTDVQLAQNLGCKCFLLGNDAKRAATQQAGLLQFCARVTPNWADIYNDLKKPGRSATVRRTTRETDIDLKLELDGDGRSAIDTGLKFFDHMLDQLARHSGCNLALTVKGDLEVDEHHTIEDTALALGEAFAKALGDKRGLERYGFCLPMDDCLAQVTLDFGGRPWLVWDATFTREKIGDMPTEMFYHFFKSFSDTAKCNLNIKAEGTNEHHKIESIFKAWARAIKMAIRRDVFSNALPTTKGVL